MSIKEKIKAIEAGYEKIKCKPLHIENRDGLATSYATVSIMGYNMCVGFMGRILEEKPVDELIDYVIYYEDIIKDHMLAMRKKGAI